MPSDKDKTIIEPGLKIIIGETTYIAHDGDVIGREGTVGIEEFSKIKTVSRRHALVKKSQGNWFVEVPAAVANSTMLNGVEIKRDEPIMIIGEQILKLSERCVVRLVAP